MDAEKFINQVESVPRAFRSAWPKSFPEVIIHAAESDVKQHQAYAAAKAGDVEAAMHLIMDTLSDVSREFSIGKK